MKSIQLMAAWMIVVSPVLADLSIKNIETMVHDIRAKRKGRVADHRLSSSPFVVIKHDQNTTQKSAQTVAKSKVSFSLGAIVNNTAFINGSWYKQGDNISGFDVASVASDRVSLDKESRKITLFFRKSKNIIKISEEK